MNPIIIYIDEPDVKDTIDSVLDERGTDWLSAVTDNHVSQGYGNVITYQGMTDTLNVLKKGEFENFVYFKNSISLTT